MNALIYSINEINRQIPKELLHAALYVDEQPVTANLTSTDEKIRLKIIKNRVALDTNIVGGIQMIISLGNVAPAFAEAYYTLYYIDPSLTNNKEIVSALNITYLPGQGFFGPNNIFYSNTSFGGYSNFNSTLNVANRVSSSASDMSIINNAHLELVAYNTILVYANYRAIMNYGIRVMLQNNEDFSNISTRSFKNFSYLCVLAAKSYIYNKLIVKINSGYLQAGQELGTFKQILDSYESAEEEYRTYLKEVWSPTAFMADTTRYNRYLKSMLSPDV